MEHLAHPPPRRQRRKERSHILLRRRKHLRQVQRNQRRQRRRLPRIRSRLDRLRKPPRCQLPQCRPIPLRQQKDNPQLRPQLAQRAHNRRLRHLAPQLLRQLRRRHRPARQHLIHLQPQRRNLHRSRSRRRQLPSLIAPHRKHVAEHLRAHHKIGSIARPAHQVHRQRQTLTHQPRNQPTRTLSLRQRRRGIRRSQRSLHQRRRRHRQLLCARRKQHQSALVDPVSRRLQRQDRIARLFPCRSACSPKLRLVKLLCRNQNCLYRFLPHGVYAQLPINHAENRPQFAVLSSGKSCKVRARSRLNTLKRPLDVS